MARNWRWWSKSRSHWRMWCAKYSRNSIRKSSRRPWPKNLWLTLRIGWAKWVWMTSNEWQRISSNATDNCTARAISGQRSTQHLNCSSKQKKTNENKSIKLKMERLIGGIWLRIMWKILFLFAFEVTAKERWLWINPDNCHLIKNKNEIN